MRLAFVTHFFLSQIRNVFLPVAAAAVVAADVLFDLVDFDAVHDIHVPPTGVLPMRLLLAEIPHNVILS